MTVVRLLSYLCHMIYEYFMLTTCTPHHSSSFSCCPDIFFTLILVDWSLESKKKRYKMNKSRKEKRWKYRTHIFTYSHCFMLTWPLVTTQDILKTHFFNFKPDLSRDLLLNLATKIDFAAKYEKKNYQYTVEKIFGCGISLRRPINTVYYSKKKFHVTKQQLIEYHFIGFCTMGVNKPRTSQNKPEKKSNYHNFPQFSSMKSVHNVKNYWKTINYIVWRRVQ